MPLNSTLYPCSTKTREVLGNPSPPPNFPRPKRFPKGEARGKSRGSREIREIFRGRGFCTPRVEGCKIHGQGKSRGRRGWISQYLPSLGGARTFSHHYQGRIDWQLHTLLHWTASLKQNSQHPGPWNQQRDVTSNWLPAATPLLLLCMQMLRAFWIGCWWKGRDKVKLAGDGGGQGEKRSKPGWQRKLNGLRNWPAETSPGGGTFPHCKPPLNSSLLCDLKMPQCLTITFD